MKKKLRKMSELVTELLVKDENCRNSDGYLYFQVLSEVADERGVDLRKTTISDFLLNMHGKDFPCFETIRRSRAKIQELRPELGACDTVKRHRGVNEAEFRDYARNYT